MDREGSGDLELDEFEKMFSLSEKLQKILDSDEIMLVIDQVHDLSDPEDPGGPSSQTNPFLPRPALLGAHS